jgi:hypothetical protein
MKTDRKIIQKRYRDKNKEKLKEKAKEYRKNNIEKIIQSSQFYKEKNKEVIREKNKEYRMTNVEKSRHTKKEYREKNKEILKEKGKIYREKNKEKYNEYRRNRKQYDILYSLSLKIQRTINISIKHKFTKNKHTLDILGCNYDYFKTYIESKFEWWMTWDNYGQWNGELNYGWDIDHIIPISSAKNEEEIIMLNHYSNLRPLCSHINRYVKKDKLAEQYLINPH